LNHLQVAKNFKPPNSLFPLAMSGTAGAAAGGAGQADAPIPLINEKVSLLNYTVSSLYFDCPS
jgi:hypothetical protein